MKQLNAFNAKSNKHSTNIPCTGTAKKGQQLSGIEIQPSTP